MVNFSKISTYALIAAGFTFVAAPFVQYYVLLGGTGMINGYTPFGYSVTVSGAFFIALGLYLLYEDKFDSTETSAPEPVNQNAPVAIITPVLPVVTEPTTTSKPKSNTKKKAKSQ